MENSHHVVPPAQRRLKRIEQAFTDPLPFALGAKCQTIHHGLDRMPLCLEKFDRLRTTQIDNLAIDSQTDEPLAPCTVYHIAEFTRLIANKRRQQHQARSLRPGEDLGCNLLGRLTADGRPG